jgi:thioredoxin reductase
MSGWHDHHRTPLAGSACAGSALKRRLRAARLSRQWDYPAPVRAPRLQAYAGISDRDHRCRIVHTLIHAWFPETATFVANLEHVGQPEDMSDYDVVVIGGGAAGLSAGLVLSRARRKVLVVDSGTPRNAPAEHMHGFLSRDGLPPGELLALGRDEVKGYGGEFLDGAVTELVRCGTSGFWVLLSNGQRVSARRLLVATGLRDELPDIPGLRERWARDVLHCPYCHGYEVRDQQLGVLGGSPDTVRYAQMVRQWADDVVFFVPTGTLTQAQRSQLVSRAIKIVEGTVQRILVEDDQLCGVELDDGRTIRRVALFVPPRFVPNNDLLVGIGCDIDEDGWVVTGINGHTSVPGVWVAGNVANPRAQVITAAGEGSAAAIALNADLVDEDVRDAVRDFNEGFLT